jgi:hypothetical protein
VLLDAGVAIRSCGGGDDGTPGRGSTTTTRGDVERRRGTYRLQGGAWIRISRTKVARNRPGGKGGFEETGSRRVACDDGEDH